MSKSECAVCGKSFTRLASHLVRSFECESYYNSRTAHNNDGPVNATNEQREGSDDRIRRKNRKSSSVREADDEEAVANVNAGAVEDDDFVMLDDDDEDVGRDAGDADDCNVYEANGEGETPDDSVLDLHLKLLKLRANPLGLARFSPEEEVLIELLQLLRELHCPLKAFEIILKWAAKSNGSGYTFRADRQPTRKKVISELFERYNMKGLIPKEKRVYMPYTQRIVSMIYFDASEVFASLLSCPTINQDENYFFDSAKDPFVAPQLSSDIGDIHSGRCYRKTYDALIKKPGVDMLLPCVMAMDKTRCDSMAGRLQMEPVTISHGLLNHNIRRLPIAMRILGYMNHSTPAHHPTGGALDPVFNMPANLPKDVVLMKDPLPRPAAGVLSTAQFVNCVTPHADRHVLYSVHVIFIVLLCCHKNSP